MRIFSRFISILGKWAIVFLSLFILGLFFEGVLQWNFVGIFGAVMFYMVQISIIYNLSHFLKALVSIVNYYYHFSKYVLYLRSFKKDQTDFDRRFIIPIQQYTNLKYLGIGDPNLLYLDTTHFSLSDNKIDLSLVFRTNKSWKRTITKLMKNSQFILVKVNATEGVMFEISCALSLFAYKTIFLIEKKDDLEFFNKILGGTYKIPNLSLPSLIYIKDEKIKTFSISNIGVSLQLCLNEMRDFLPKELHEINASKLYWDAWDIIHETNNLKLLLLEYIISFRGNMSNRYEKAAIMLWKSYCNGYTPSLKLLKIILNRYPDLKGIWNQNLI